MNAAHQKAEDARAGKIYNKGTIDTKTIAKEIEEVTKSEYVTKEAKSDLNKSNITYITTKTNSRIEKEEQNKIVSEINKTRKETNITEPKVTGTIGLGSIPKTTGNNTKSPNNEQKYQALFNEWIKTSPDRLKDLSALDYFKLRILSEGTKNNISKYTMEELDKIYLEEYKYKSQIQGIQSSALTLWGIKSAYTSYIENNRVVQEAKSVGNAAKGAGKAVTNLGQSYGKFGTVVENPGAKITGFSRHAVNQAITRGVTTEVIQNTVNNPVAVLSQRGGTSFAYVSNEAVVVVKNTGEIITTYGKSNFDAIVQQVLKEAIK